MIAKLIAYGDTREMALARMRIALSEMIVGGIKTNISLHQDRKSLASKDQAFTRFDPCYFATIQAAILFTTSCSIPLNP
jgi:acetyl/propionyl-CoA carboxylase alpha subunit